MSASDGSVKIKAVLEYDGQDHESEELELEIVGESIPPNLDVSNSTVIFVPVIPRGETVPLKVAALTPQKNGMAIMTVQGVR